MTSLPPHTVGSSDADLKGSQVVAKRWLRLAIDKRELLPKQIYLELGKDKSTFSRWISYEDEHCVPLDLVLDMLPLLGEQALESLISLLREAHKRGAA